MLKIGIDIGGTTIKGALFDGAKILEEHSAPTCGGEGREAIVRQLFEVADSLQAEKASFIGVSSAANIDPASGRCVYATDNLKGWTGTEIVREMEERYSVACRADNDAVCALIGELSLREAPKDVTLLTFGTGVGGASLINGKIVRGRRFDAARWGHFSLHPGGRVCNCGKRGCAEQYLSATALLRAGRERDEKISSCEELFAAFRKEEGRGAMTEVVEAFASDLLLLLDDIITAVSPDCILLGGGLTNAWDIFAGIGNLPSVVGRAQLGSKAGIYGASLLETAAY